MQRAIFSASVLLAIAGCSQAPPLSGGKPIEHWVAAVNDPDAKVRATAVDKLGNAGAPDEAAWDALHKALQDRDAKVRKGAIIAMMKCGPRAQEAVPALQALQQRDVDPQVRDYAGKAAKKLLTERPAASPSP